MDDLIYGNLDDYHVFIMAGLHDEHLYCGYPLLPFVDDIKNTLEQFIRDGGGYIGHCAWAFGTTEYLYLYVFEDTSQMR